MAIKPTGDCYEAAARLVAFNRPIPLSAGAVLCHGIVTGQGAIVGQRIGHAWVEHLELVYDYSNGQRKVFSKQAYYKLGQIRDEETIRCTRTQARELMLIFEHYGPWEQIEED